MSQTLAQLLSNNINWSGTANITAESGSVNISATGANSISLATNGSTRVTVNSSGQILAGSLGTAALPVWSFTGDTNTGLYSPGADIFALSTGGSERWRVTSGGNFLFGTSVTFGDAEAFQIASTGGNNFAIGRFSTDLGPPDFSFYKARGTIGVPTIVANNDNLGQLSFSGWDSAQYVKAASVSALVDGTPGAGDLPTRLVFATTTDGSITPVEKLRITNDGVIAYSQAEPISKAAATTLTIAELKNGIIQYTGGAATLTLPTGTLTEGGFSGIYTNMTFEWSVINTGSGTCTIGAGASHTIIGLATLAANTAGRFATRRTAANTFISYRIS